MAFGFGQKTIKYIFKTVDETSPEAFGIKMSYLEDPPSEQNTPCDFKIGDSLSVRDSEAKLHNGIVDTIEWSITFKTWCYRLMGGKNTPYWVYQNSKCVSHQFSVCYAEQAPNRSGKRPTAKPPLKLPDPISIME